MSYIDNTVFGKNNEAGIRQSRSRKDDIEAAYAAGDISDEQYGDLQNDEAVLNQHNKMRYFALAVLLFLIGGLALAGSL